MGLLDFLQSASNTSAETVTVPVDLIAGLLRSMNVPVGEMPVGGKKWMKKKGLIQDVPNGYAKTAGETMGLLMPAMALSKYQKLGLLDPVK